MVEYEKIEKNKEKYIEIKDVCPICGSENLIKQGRCVTCFDCGWSKCDV